MSDIIDELQEAGLDCFVIDHGAGKCVRCGAVATELAFQSCFPCGMWEDPESSDLEIIQGAQAALQMGMTVDMWYAGRKNWGRLVPSEAQMERIRTLVTKYIREQLVPWCEEHKK